MDPKRIVALVVGASVMVLIFSAILVPIVNEATTTEKTFTNVGIFNYGTFSSTDTYTFAYDQNDQDGTIEVNGEPMTVPSIGPSYSNSFSVIYDEDWLIRMSYSVNQGGYYAQIVGLDTSNNAFRYGGSITAAIDNGVFKVEIDTNSDGTVDQTKSMAIKNMYAIVPNPDDAVLKVSTEAVYIKGDTSLSMSGLTAIANWYDMIHIEGSYTDGVEISSPNLAGATFSNVEWNIEPVSGYIDLYKLTSIEFDITYNDATTHATYSYFGVPTEVTADIAVTPDSGTRAMLNAIPIIAMIGIILAVVSVAIVGRNDY